jgi:thiol-disulfide isomerase/thioredoxin
MEYDKIRTKFLEPFKKFYLNLRRYFSIYFKETKLFWNFFVEKKYIYLWIPAVAIFLFTDIAISKVKIDFSQNGVSQQANIFVETKKQITVDGNFNQIIDAQVCQENGKPIIYFFGSISCPHCKWEKPVISAVAQKFGSAISYHENIDNGKEMDVFNKYSTGSIPTVVIGCKYYRVGSGESAGVEKEVEVLTKLICNITGGYPVKVCGK